MSTQQTQQTQQTKQTPASLMSDSMSYAEIKIWRERLINNPGENVYFLTRVYMEDPSIHQFLRADEQSIWAKNPGNDWSGVWAWNRVRYIYTPETHPELFL